MVVVNAVPWTALVKKYIETVILVVLVVGMGDGAMVEVIIQDVGG